MHFRTLISVVSLFVFMFLAVGSADEDASDSKSTSRAKKSSPKKSSASSKSSAACKCLKSGPGPDSAGRTRRMYDHQMSCISSHGRSAVEDVLHKNKCRPVPCYPKSSHGCTSLDYIVLRKLGAY